MSSEVTVELDVPAEMRDGAVLRANVYRPAGEGRWPVLLTRLPYGKDFPLGGAVLDPVQTARQGYVVVVQDTRGRFTSGGDWYPMVHEADDGCDTVQWAASLPYADGQVGTYGASYFGFTQWAAASQRPPALRAMVPNVTWNDPFNGLVYRGGAIELGTHGSWHLNMGLDVLARRHRHDPPALRAAVRELYREYDALGLEGYASLPLQDFGPHRRQDVGSAFLDVLRRPLDPDDPLVRATSVHSWQDGVDVPTLNIGGWYDCFLGDTIANFCAMRERGRPTQLLIGPWSHTGQMNPIGERNFGFGAQAAFIDLEIDLGSLQRRWFDHWLRGMDTGLLDRPPIRLFTMGTNEWRYEETWPPAGVEAVPHYLHAGGRLSLRTPGDEAPDRYDYDPADPVPTHGGATLLTPEFRPGPWDQARVEARPDVLVYTSDPLDRDVEVTGPVEAHLWAVTSAPDTDWVVRLCDVLPDGRSLNLTDGIVRARYREGARDAAPSLVEPGHPYHYVIDLWSTSNVFQAGHRIRVQVTSSCFPRWDRNPNTGHAIGETAELRVAHQQVLHDQDHPSHVVLPVRQAV